jgi:hypothetical protein
MGYIINHEKGKTCISEKYKLEKINANLVRHNMEKEKSAPNSIPGHLAMKQP